MGVLDEYHDGGEKVKQVKLQLLRKRYELMQMEENLKISDYFSKLIVLVNQMKICDKGVTDQQMV